MYYKTNDPTRNSMGYKDMTAYLALQRIELEAEEARRAKRSGRKVKHHSRKDNPRGKSKRYADR